MSHPLPKLDRMIKKIKSVPFFGVLGPLGILHPYYTRSELSRYLINLTTPPISAASFQTRRDPPNLSRRTRSEISLYLPPAPRRTSHKQSLGTVSQVSGDLSKDMLRNKIRKRTDNPQYPSQPRVNRQKTRCPSKGVCANSSHCRYGDGSICLV